MSPGFRLGILLIFATAPLVAATPNLGPEVAVDVPQPGPVVAGSRSVAVASNGSVALAVWEEYRSGESDIFATRIDAAGNPLDPYSIQVTATPIGETTPRVAWDGTSFVVAWNIFDDYSRDPLIWMTSVGADGRVSDTRISGGRGNLEDMTAAFGAVALAVTRRPPVGSNTAAVLLFAGGKLTSDVTLAKDAIHPRVAATASGFAAAWMITTRVQDGEVHFARFSPYGAFDVADLRVAVTTPFYDSEEFDLAARGDETIIAIGGKQVALFRVTRAGQLLPIANIPIKADVDDLRITDAGLVATVRTDHAMLWTLSLAGDLVDSKQLAASSQVRGAVAVLGGRVYVITTSAHPEPANLYGRFAGDPQPQLISKAAESQAEPVIATDGEHLLIAWHVLNAVKGVMATRDGHPIGAPFEIFADNSVDSPLATTFSAGEYVVLRQEGGPNGPALQTLVATHVSRDGVPRHDRLVISETAHLYGHPAVATDGTNLAIAWDGSFEGDGKVSMLTPAGIAPLTLDFGFTPGIALAWSGSMFVAAVPGTLSIARITREGKLASSAYLQPSVFGSKLSIAFGGDGFLVTYLRAAVSTPTSSVMALPLDRDARQSGDPITIQLAGADTPKYYDPPRLAWNGSTYDVAWIGSGSDAKFAGSYIARLGHDGRVIERLELPLVPSATAPFVLGLGNGQSIIAYSRAVPELGGSLRVFTRLLTAPHDRAVRH